jgi:hypothetical protein
LQIIISAWTILAGQIKWLTGWNKEEIQMMKWPKSLGKSKIVKKM